MTTLLLLGLLFVGLLVLTFGPDRALLWPRGDHHPNPLQHPALNFLHEDDEAPSEVG